MLAGQGPNLIQFCYGYGRVSTGGACLPSEAQSSRQGTPVAKVAKKASDNQKGGGRPSAADAAAKGAEATGQSSRSQP